MSVRTQGQHSFFLSPADVPAGCQNVRGPTSPPPFQSFTVSSLIVCFVNVSLFPICVVSTPGPGNICAGTVVKAPQPYLFIFPLTCYHMVSDDSFVFDIH